MSRELIESELEIAREESLEQAGTHLSLLIVYGFYAACLFVPVIIPALPFVIGYHLYVMLTRNTGKNPELDRRIERLEAKLAEYDADAGN